MNPNLASHPRIEVIDTHTGGEPTRVVVAGGPDLGSSSLADRRELFRERFDSFRSAVVNEPRGSDVMVGALVVPPVDKSCAAGVLFFNNVGFLGMCGHGTIGLVVALGHAGRLAAGTHRLETPVGTITVEYDGANRVAFDNVPSYRHAAGVSVEVEGVGRVTGDVAWGGNWFFLVHDHHERLELANVERLTDAAWRIRQALTRRGITGEAGAEIDHIELFGPPRDATAHSRNFVLCPGKAYDRSPCGTGTSAKLACLYADGILAEGQVWRQESIVGSVFEGAVRSEAGRIIPRIAGTAYVTGESKLILDPGDPFQMGIRQL
ncbi:MAG TPA: proline racemase family protein [Pirellulales bacterium]|nr:proline racemase family protein [Pirellulales bacterium]